MEDKAELNLLSTSHLLLKTEGFRFKSSFKNDFSRVDDFLSSPKSASGGCGAVKCFKNFKACS
jgi:hypothetical protein